MKKDPASRAKRKIIPKRIETIPELKDPMPLDLRKLSERVSEKQSPLRQAPRSSGPGNIGGAGATGTWPATQGGHSCLGMDGAPAPPDWPT